MEKLLEKKSQGKNKRFIIGKTTSNRWKMITAKKWKNCML